MGRGPLVSPPGHQPPICGDHTREPLGAPGGPAAGAPTLLTPHFPWGQGLSTVGGSRASTVCLGAPVTCPHKRPSAPANAPRSALTGVRPHVAQPAPGPSSPVPPRHAPPSPTCAPRPGVCSLEHPGDTHHSTMSFRTPDSRDVTRPHHSLTHPPKGVCHVPARSVSGQKVTGTRQRPS